MLKTIIMLIIYPFLWLIGWIFTNAFEADAHGIKAWFAKTMVVAILISPFFFDSLSTY